MIEISDIREVSRHVDGLQAVIFDLDDTLYSEKEYVRNGYQEIANLFADPKEASEELWHLFQYGKAAIDEFLQERNIYTEELKQTCLERYRLQKPTLHLYEGVRELLYELKQKYRLGLITDGRPEGQRAKIEALELAPIFDHMIITDELGGMAYRKPNPKAFEEMAKVLDIPFQQMCYVGDNIKKDFIAPEQLGMKSIWFRNHDGIYKGDRK